MNNLDQLKKVPNSRNNAQLLQKQFGYQFYYRVSIGPIKIEILFGVKENHILCVWFRKAFSVE
jgi:hypothetical protein